MKKKYRLLKNNEFYGVMKKGRKIGNKNFRIYFLLKKESFSRIGISVSKKRGNAVIRNKFKRQIKVMIVSLIDFISFDFDLVIIPTKKYDKKEFWKNYNECKFLIKEMKRKK